MARAHFYKLHKTSKLNSSYSGGRPITGGGQNLNDGTMMNMLRRSADPNKKAGSNQYVFSLMKSAEMQGLKSPKTQQRGELPDSLDKH